MSPQRAAQVLALRAPSELPPPGDAWQLRMKDLCDLTGLPRQAIHFYITQGLLPAGRKTGRNMAFYGDEHVERLKLIKKLQHERFLPLKAIKAILDDRESAFTEVQRSFLVGVKQHLTTSSPEAGPKAAVDADEVIARLGLPRSDLDRMIEIGLLGARVDEATGHTLIAEDDVWILSGWADVVRLGFAREMGFTVDDLLQIQDVVQELFNREAQMVASRMARLEAKDAAMMIERSLPIIHGFITGFHTAKVRDFFASLS